jgi:hypothetical protein
MHPFEIRADVLAMTKDYMDRQQEITAEFAKRAFDVALNSGKVTASTWQEFVPNMYTLDELTKKAQEMYSFVINSKGNENQVLQSLKPDS